MDGIARVSSAMTPSMAPFVYPEGSLLGEDEEEEHHRHPGRRQGQAEALDPDTAKPLMELSYDKLVYAVGTKTGTFGVPGVREYCYMLKVGGREEAAGGIWGSRPREGSISKSWFWYLLVRYGIFWYRRSG